MFKTLTLNKGYGDSPQPLMEQIGITLKYDFAYFSFSSRQDYYLAVCFLTLTGL